HRVIYAVRRKAPPCIVPFPYCHSWSDGTEQAMTRTGETVLTVSSLVAVGTSAAAAFIIWLLLTQPLTVAGAISDRDLMPLFQAMASALAHVVTAVLRYL